MTSAFAQQAESEIAETSSTDKPDEALAGQIRRYSIALNRHELAKNLMAGIRAELESKRPRILCKKGTIVPMLDWHSVRAWAYEEFEISVAVESGPIAEFEAEGDHPKYSEKLRGLIGPRGYSQIKTASLLASFYVLLFEFAKQRPADYLKHNEVVVDELAKELSGRSAKNHDYFKSYAQSMASWKLQIQTANEVLKSALEFRPRGR